MSSSRRIRAVILKEWAEVWANRMVLFTVVGVPLVLVGVSLPNLLITSILPPEAQAEPVPTEMLALCDGLEGMPCMQVYMASLFSMIFLIIPALVPSTIAAYAIVGEKNGKTLEPLLATPITTVELVVAKLIASVAPGIASGWLAFVVWIGGAALLVDHEVLVRIAAPRWWLATALLGPAIGVAATAMSLAVSSRASDPRVAQQLAGLVVLPIVAISVGQILGLVLVSDAVVVGAFVAMCAIDVLLVGITVQLFGREAILTRWS